MKKLFLLLAFVILFSASLYAAKVAVSRPGCFAEYKPNTSVPICNPEGEICYTWYDDGSTKEGEPCDVFVFTNPSNLSSGDGYLDAVFIQYGNNSEKFMVVR